MAEEAPKTSKLTQADGAEKKAADRVTELENEKKAMQAQLSAAERAREDSEAKVESLTKERDQLQSEAAAARAPPRRSEQVAPPAADGGGGDELQALLRVIDPAGRLRTLVPLRHLDR